MYKGTIRKKHEKGFGFIKLGDGSEVFFHATQCVTPFERLNEGDNVQFDTEYTAKGLRGIKVTRL